MYKKKIFDKNNIQNVRLNKRDFGELLACFGLATTGLVLSVNVFESYL